MGQESSINKENLLVLMETFYKKAIQDDVLGSFFVDELGDDIKDEEWVDHIDTLANFWLAVLLGEKTYEGNYLGRHYGVPYISRESFIRWIELFTQTTDEVYTAEVSKIFKEKSILLADEFMDDLAI